MSIQDISVVLLVGALIIVGAVGLLGLFSVLRKRITNPKAASLFDLVVAALTPYLYKAIFAGEKLALLAMTDLNVKLDGLDKKAIADQVYDLLPSSLLVGDIPMPIGLIKTIVTKSAFEALVEQIYTESHLFIIKNEDYLKQEVDAFLPGAANTPILPAKAVTLTPKS